MSPEDLNQDFNSIPDFVHLPPRIQLAYSLPSSLENIASVSATPPGTLNNRLTCSISRTLSTVSTTPTVSQQSLSNPNRRQSSHPVSIAPAIVQLPATSITVPFISPFSAAQQPRMLVAVNNKPASVNQSNVRWPSVVSSSSPVSAVPVCRETLSVAQRQLGQRLSLQPYV